MTVSLKEFVTHLIYVVIIGCILTLIYPYCLDLIVSWFSKIKYENWDPVNKGSFYFFIVFGLLMSHIRMASDLYGAEIRFTRGIQILNGILDILALPLSILILVIYRNYFPPKYHGTNLPDITEVAPVFTLFFLFLLKIILLPPILSHREKRSLQKR